jgi:hypothetical protein
MGPSGRDDAQADGLKACCRSFYRNPLSGKTCADAQQIGKFSFQC